MVIGALPITSSSACRACLHGCCSSLRGITFPTHYRSTVHIISCYWVLFTETPLPPTQSTLVLSIYANYVNCAHIYFLCVFIRFLLFTKLLVCLFVWFFCRRWPFVCCFVWLLPAILIRDLLLVVHIRLSPPTWVPRQGAETSKQGANLAPFR